MKKNMGVAMALLAAGIVAGCSVAQPFARVDYYQFDYPAPESRPQGQPVLEAVVGVRRFGIASAYDHDRLVQKEKDLRTTQSYYHRWVANPRMLLSELLLRDLLAMGSYKAVVMMPANVLPDYEVNGFIQEMLRDESGKESAVRIVMDVTLLRGNLGPQEAHRIVFQKKYSCQKSCADRTPSGVARAMSAAYQDISRDIQSDVYEGIKTTR